MQMIYQGLFTLNQSFDAAPVLCKDFSVSDDGLTYTRRCKVRGFPMEAPYPPPM